MSPTETTRASVAAHTADSNDSPADAPVAISLEANGSGSALFSAPAMVPGDTLVRCVEVSYDGTVDAWTRLRSTVTDGTGLERYLDLTVERGAGDCDHFGPAVAVWNDGTLDDFTASGWTEGRRVAGTEAGSRIPYRFTVVLVDDNAAQGLTSDFSLLIEGRP